MTRTVIVGGVAAGMSAATRLRRLDAAREIIVIEAGDHVSYANCGLPYYAGGVIRDRDSLLLQTPARLRERFDLDVRIHSRATQIDPERRQVRIETANGDTYALDYDSLVLSPGARPVVPAVPGSERALVLRDVADVDAMVDQLQAARSAVVIGAGFVGLEVAENLARKGIEVTVVESAPQVMTALDEELSIRIAQQLEAHGVTVRTGSHVRRIDPDTVVVETPTVGEQTYRADMVVAAIGVVPDTALAAAAGIATGPRGGILVDDRMETSVAGIYAVGDAAAKRDALSPDHDPALIPLANLANRHGRRAADAIHGIASPSPGSIGTAIVEVFGLTAAVTGRTERRLRVEGRPYRALHSHASHHATYYPGAAMMAMKLLIDPETDLILGAQAVGTQGVDKRIDVIATAIAGGLTASALADLELAYAPAFGSAKDPVNMLGYMAENVASGLTPTVQWGELADLEQAVIVDVRSAAEHDAGAVVPTPTQTAMAIPLDELRARHSELPRDGLIVVHCQVGQRGHTATRLLRELGFTAVNLGGGYLTWRDGMVARGVLTTVDA